MKKIIFTLIFLFFWSTNVLSAPVIHKHTVIYDNGNLIAGVAFSDDGKKVFTSFANKDDTVGHHINEFNLAVPYDISTGTYAGDGERCLLDQISTGEQVYDLEIKDSGKKLFVTTRGLTTVEAASRLADNIFRYDLETAFDISTCAFSHKAPSLETEALELINGSNAGNVDLSTRFKRKDHRLQGIDLSPNGKKMFLSWFNSGDATRLLEYDLNNPFDLTTMSLVTSAGIRLTTSDDNGVNNAAGISFSKNGKRIFIVSHAHNGVARITQISLKSAFDTSAFTIDGNLAIDQNGSLGDFNNQPRGIDFSPSGLKMYVGNDHDDNTDELMEYDLACPFNLFSGKCSELTDDKERAGIAEAQIKLANRTIDYSTTSAFNRLKWIKRNKDKQDLTNLNMDIHFSNKVLAKLNEAVKASLNKTKVTTTINGERKKRDIFYWNELSLAVGESKETSTSLSTDIQVNSFTYGADILTKNNSVMGVALRYGADKVEVGSSGSELDSNTLNLTFYNSKPSENESKFFETIIGIGIMETDINTSLDGKDFFANNRLGQQIYTSLKAEDHFEIEKLKLIHSVQFDYGFTKLHSYFEEVSFSRASGGLNVDDQNIHTSNLRTSFAAVHDTSNDRFIMKRHGRLEYQAAIHRSSDFKYSYNNDINTKYSTELSPGSIHNLNGEIGIDIEFKKYKLFLIYERNQSLNYGHIDKIHFAYGFLPNKTTEYKYSFNGSENINSSFSIDKNINNLNFTFKIENELLDPLEYNQAKVLVHSKF